MDSTTRKAEVWAVGGGKGGTGKSFFTSSIGCLLCARGYTVILVDADLGGANLHSFFGLKRPKRTLTDFFENRVELKDIVVPTPVDNLSLVIGDLQSIDSDGIKFTQKQKLFRHIRALQADYVVLDLGAGAHYNTLDSFLLADRMLTVTAPDITAIENLYHFVRNVFYRKLKMSLTAHGMKDMVVDAWKNRSQHGIANLGDLVEYLKKRSPSLSGTLDAELATLDLNVVLNQARDASASELGLSISSVIRKYLGLRTHYAGKISRDEQVVRCLNRGEPYVRMCPERSSARELNAILDSVFAHRPAGGKESS